MSKQIEALKLALEALEVATTPLAKDRQEVLRAIIAIREALAQPDRIQLTVKDFVVTVGGIEDAVGTPTYWAEWPNKEQS